MKNQIKFSDCFIKYYLKVRQLSYNKLNFLFFIVFLLSYLLFFGNILDFISSDFLLHINEEGKNVSIGSNATVNINNPNVSASVSKEGVNNIAAAVSAAGGATAGIKVAQYVAGPPSVKIMAGLGTMAVVQATTGIMSKVLNNNSKNSNFLYQYINSNNLNNNCNDINKYPLNLLFDVNILLYAALLFLLIILNIHTVSYLSKINYEKYISNKK